MSSIPGSCATPELGLFYQIVEKPWASFKEETDEHGGLPLFVKDEIDGYLQCGILDHGFIRARCKDCGHEELVAFSCKGRGFCPSCIGRRMNDTAAHLVDTVLPQVPIRQWVCSFSWQLRYVMGYDKKLTSEILSAFMSTVIQGVKRRAKRMLNLASMDSAETGAVLAVFYPLPDPTERDVNWVAQTSWKRIEKVLKKHGRLPDDEQTIDVLSEEQPATGKGIVAQYEGIEVHADTVLDGRDRKRLERLVRYIARPPIAQDRLEAVVLSPHGISLGLPSPRIGLRSYGTAKSNIP